MSGKEQLHDIYTVQPRSVVSNVAMGCLDTSDIPTRVFYRLQNAENSTTKRYLHS